MHKPLDLWGGGGGVIGLTMPWILTLCAFPPSIGSDMLAPGAIRGYFILQSGCGLQLSALTLESFARLTEVAAHRANSAQRLRRMIALL
jgi:hypothetical protein